MALKTMQVKSEQNPYFGFFWELYVSSFPEEERRGMDYQLRTLEKENYYLEILLNESEAIGFIAWWDFGDIRYIEHFAMSAECRGKGYGEESLRDFVAQSAKTVLLEVEHPTSDINRRRIAFYERNGFVLTPHAYAHPSYHSPLAHHVSLRVMTHPNAISAEALEEFKQRAFREVHFL